MNSDTRRIRTFGVLAGGLGGLAAVAELVGGTSAWTGNKSDPTTLGLVTLGLAAVIGASAWWWPRRTTNARRVGLAVAMIVPALVGTTTAGAAWVPAALVGLYAGGRALAVVRREGALRLVVRAHWSTVLMFVLAAVHLTFGIVARSAVGLLGIAGALAVVVAWELGTQRRWWAVGLLAAGAIPFALATFSTVVTPLTAVLLLAVGLPHLLGGRPVHPVVGTTAGHFPAR
jgi:hypothetical protein